MMRGQGSPGPSPCSLHHAEATAVDKLDKLTDGNKQLQFVIFLIIIIH